MRSHLQAVLTCSRRTTPSRDTENEEGHGLFVPQPHRTSSSGRQPYVESEDSAAEPEFGDDDANDDRYSNYLILGLGTGDPIC